MDQVQKVEPTGSPYNHSYSRSKDIWGEMGRTCREQCRMDGCYTSKKEWEKHNQKAMTNTIVHIHIL
jgi:hypothetical protein